MHVYSGALHPKHRETSWWLGSLSALLCGAQHSTPEQQLALRAAPCPSQAVWKLNSGPPMGASPARRHRIRASYPAGAAALHSGAERWAVQVGFLCLTWLVAPLPCLRLIGTLSARLKKQSASRRPWQIVKRGWCALLLCMLLGSGGL